MQTLANFTTKIAFRKLGDLSPADYKEATAVSFEPFSLSTRQGDAHELSHKCRSFGLGWLIKYV
ncbi:hypothetical protein BPA01_51270 [Brevibacillus parabrevis]|uniref:Uncharacterized protein n=1 Tax=Brevibacillus parabrevis TaxID=54914 RepID=A0A4Y3PQR0_BREPA|nr:hypothetical protein BPA01_51270 [Brevibacillus parabrevis]